MSNSSNSNVETAHENGLEPFIKLIQTDVPPIETSVKNLIALVVGNSYVSDSIDLKSAMTCGKTLLQVVQRFPLLEVDEYCSKYPQQETQSGLHRLDEVCKYKTVYELRKSALAVQGSKISKLFGKLYFQWTDRYLWQGVRDEVESILIANHSNSVTVDEINLFLNTYEQSFNVAASSATGSSEKKEGVQDAESTAQLGGNNDDLQEYSRLVWASDFTAALAQRQERRKALVAGRVASVSAAKEELSGSVADALLQDEE